MHDGTPRRGCAELEIACTQRLRVRERECRAEIGNFKLEIVNSGDLFFRNLQFSIFNFQFPMSFLTGGV
jgi:hypothetical protein